MRLPGGWPAFASSALSTAAGTVIGAGAIYLVAAAAGVVQRAPTAIVSSVVGVLVGAVAATLLPLYRRRLDKETEQALTLPPEDLARAIKGAVGRHPAGALSADEIRRRFSTLPERQQRILTLRYGSRLTTREIADLYGIAPNTVRFWVANAVGELAGSGAPRDRESD
jgi:RNA polymerase sigma factor (sigma-70 family)